MSKAQRKARKVRRHGEPHAKQRSGAHRKAKRPPRRSRW